MKRKVKRKVFLMGMAVAAIFPAGAFAQESGKLERHGAHYSSGGRGAPISAPADMIQEAPEMRINDEGDGMPSSLLDKLTGIAESLSSRAVAVSVSEQDTAWKLEMSQTEPIRLGLIDNPRVATSKPVGVALHLKF